MALEDINLSFLGEVKQAHVPITDNSVVTLVEYEVDSRIWVWRLEISSNIAAKFTVRSGSNIIFEMHAGQKWGHVGMSEARSPRYVTNEGESLTIQASEGSLDANVYLQYQVRKVEG